ncbi:MAG: universal stress protein [Acidobacteria bacterium]|nr:universal stress protein [Acidobacteriota bacterium]
MYKTILLPLENSPADKTILKHIEKLARIHGSRLLLMHVADGWVARNYDRLILRESEEMRKDRAYLEEVCAELCAKGFQADYYLAHGEPADEIIRLVCDQHVDLIAMSTHGHGLLKDWLFGSVARSVRHNVTIPVLLLKAQPEASTTSVQESSDQR